MRIIQIVPELPPVLNGVGDYAFHLACQLRQDYGIETRFVVGNPSGKISIANDGFEVETVFDRSAKALFLLLSANFNGDKFYRQMPILLHYSGYNYALKGSPVWLVEGLELWIANATNCHLVTMFHEVCAPRGLPWKSYFWLYPLQRNLAARLVRLSDRALTNTQSYAEMLSKFAPGKDTDITTLPVFSTIGEPEQIPPLKDRVRRLVIFGMWRRRRQIYQEFLGELSHVCQLLGIEEIWDIGRSTGINLSSVREVPIIEVGEQEASKISRIMLNAIAGFFHYRTSYLGKSTIFAAYCAHGLLPVRSQSHSWSLEGIEARKCYWVPELQTIALPDWQELQAIADRAYTWYQAHKLSIQAQVFAAQLRC